MDTHSTQQLLLVTVVLVAAALIGLGLGRLLRGSLPAASTARTARAREYLQACYDPNITSEARLLNSFEAVYFCCVDVTEHIGMALERLDHPDSTLVDAALRKLYIPEADVVRIRALLEWRLYTVPSQPKPCTEDAAFALAKTIYIKTLKFLQG